MNRETFDTLVDQWLMWGFDTRRWTASTRRSRSYQIRQAERWLTRNREVSLRYAKKQDVEAWWRACGSTPGHRNNHRATLISFFQWLKIEGKRGDNPAVDLPRMRSRRPMPKALTSKQARAVLAAADAQGRIWSVAIRLMLLAGLRKTEARMLTWGCFDPDWSYLRYEAKPSNKERVSAVHSELADHAAAWKAASPDLRWVLPSPRGWSDAPASGTWLANGVAHIGSVAGIEGLHPHQLRHTFATELLESGAHIAEVQEALGHESLQTTSIYLTVRPARLADAIARLNF